MYIIPFIYIIYILIKIKQKLHSKTYENNVKQIENILILPNIFYILKNLFNNSFQNSLSAQGILIFGIINLLIIKIWYDII